MKATLEPIPNPPKQVVLVLSEEEARALHQTVVNLYGQTGYYAMKDLRDALAKALGP